MASNRQSEPTDEVFDELYEKYGKPLEPDRRGKYLAVSLRGKTIVAETLAEAASRGAAELGRGSLLFKIGDGTAGNWR